MNVPIALIIMIVTATIVLLCGVAINSMEPKPLAQEIKPELPEPEPQPEPQPQPQPKPEPKPEPIKPEPLLGYRPPVLSSESIQVPPVKLQKHGAHAILMRARRAKALARPGQGVAKGTDYHVVRLESRALAVMLRTNGESATDRIVAKYPADGGAEAWAHRNRLQYGRAG